jgi:S-adenosylmethionine decarboxylase
MQTGQKMKKIEFEQKNIFGWELILNLYNCDETIIKSQERLIEFVTRLCDILKIKKFGEPLIKRFGSDNTKEYGYTLVQLVETSSITFHISEQTRSVYINIFSCKYFDRNVAKKFCIDSFLADKVIEHYLIRE